MDTISALQCDTTTTPVPVAANQEAVLLGRELARMRGIQPPVPVLPIVLTFRGSLDLSVLRQALNGLLIRHPALRAQFSRSSPVTAAERRRRLRSFARTGVFAPGLYSQTLVPTDSIALPVSDVSHLPERERLERLDEAYKEDSCRPFDNPPRLRARLFLKGPVESVLQIVVDHLVCDVWSARLLRNDLLSLYKSNQQKKVQKVSQTAVNFLDYAAWEHDAFQSGGFDTAIEYWRSQWMKYGNARIAPAALPFAVAPLRNDPGFAHSGEPLSDDVAVAIKRFASEHRCSFHNVLLAAFVILLHQYTGLERLAFLGYFANRSRPETADVVGWFANGHLIGVEVSDKMTIETLVASLGRRIAEAAAHEDIPLHLLWRKLNCVPRYRDIRPMLDTYPASSPVSLSGGVRVFSGPAPPPVGGGVSQFGTSVGYRDCRLTINTHTSLSCFSQDAASGLARDMKDTIERLVSASTEDTIGDFEMPDRVGRYEDAVLAQDELSEYVVLDPRCILDNHSQRTGFLGRDNARKLANGWSTDA